jgi:hypothetical protein
MDWFEFLRERYSRPEQIVAGTVQVFRARHAASGQDVLVHRVSTTEAPEEQASLMKLLTTVLIKSSEAKKRVLDIGEEHGYWYVVTENEARCGLLREWLQLEIEAAAPPAGEFAEGFKPAERGSTETPGEFTRLFKAGPRSMPDKPAMPVPRAGDRFVQRPDTPVNLPPAPPPKPVERGEFARLSVAGEKTTPFEHGPSAVMPAKKKLLILFSVVGVLAVLLVLLMFFLMSNK